MMITHEINMDLERSGAPVRIDAVRGDACTRQLRISLFSGGQAWEVPDDVNLLARFCKPDGTGGAYDSLPDDTAAISVSGSVVTVVLAPQVLTAAGLVWLDVCLFRNSAVISTFRIHIEVQPNASSGEDGSQDYYVSEGFVPTPADPVEGQFLRVTQVSDGGLVRQTRTAGVGEGMVDVLVNERMDLTEAEGNVTRQAYPVGGPISLGDADCVRLNTIGVRAVPGSAVRFALYGAARDGDAGTLTRLDVIGDAVADSVTGLAALELGGSYEITRDGTVILALAEESAVRCCELGPGLVTRNVIFFDDGNYRDDETGTTIPCGYTTGQSGESSIICAVYVRDLDHLTRCTLHEFIRESMTRLGKAEEGVSRALPAVSYLDEGKILQVAGGAWTTAESPSGGVSSWNDLTDRPFYEESGEVAIFPEQEVAVEYVDTEDGVREGGGIILPAPFALVAGETYRLVCNGVAHELVCQQLYEGVMALLHEVLDESGVPQSGSVVLVYYSPEARNSTEGAAELFVYDSDEPATCTLAVYHDETVIKTLDARYLPMDAIDQRIDAYIEEALGGDY